MRTILALLIVVIAVIPRLAYVNASADALVFSDMKAYLQTARHVAEGKGIITDSQHRAYRAPIYPMLLGVCLKGVAPSVHSLRFLQAVLGALSCGLLFSGRGGLVFISQQDVCGTDSEHYHTAHGDVRALLRQDALSRPA